MEHSCPFTFGSEPKASPGEDCDSYVDEIVRADGHLGSPREDERDWRLDAQIGERRGGVMHRTPAASDSMLRAFFCPHCPQSWLEMTVSGRGEATVRSRWSWIVEVGQVATQFLVSRWQLVSYWFF